MSSFTRGDPPRRARHLAVFIACVVLLALLPFALRAVGFPPQQAVEGTALFVDGLGHLVELHAVMLISSLVGSLVLAVYRMRH